MTTLNYFRHEGPGFRVRTVGLVIWGVLMIIGGSMTLLSALGAPMQLILMRMGGRSDPWLWAQALNQFLANALMGGGLLWLGIGSCTKRRWVSPVVVSIAWPTVVGGVLFFLAIPLVLPEVHKLANQVVNTAASKAATMPAATMPVTMPATLSATVTPSPFTPVPPPPPTPGQVAMAIYIVAGVGAGMILVLYVLIPALMIWHYRRAEVVQTLKYLDQQPRWTDGRPLPLLIVSINAAVAAVSMLVGALHPIVPFFGHWYTGLTGSGVMVAEAAVMAVIAVLAYRLRPAAIWLAIAVVLLGAASLAATLWRADLDSVPAALDPSFRRVLEGVDLTILQPAMRRACLVLAAGTALVIAFLLKARKWCGPAGST